MSDGFLRQGFVVFAVTENSFEPAQSLAEIAPKSGGKGLALVRYRSLFSGPAVERVQQLQFQRPLAEVELSYEDATKRGIEPGADVDVRSNGTSRTLRARVNRRLRAGVVRIPSEHSEGLQDSVEVTST